MQDKFLTCENAQLRSELIKSPLEYKLLLGITPA